MACNIIPWHFYTVMGIRQTNHPARVLTAGVTAVESENGSHGGTVIEDRRGERGEDHAV